MNLDIFVIKSKNCSLNFKFTSDTAPKNLNEANLLIDSLLMKIGDRTVGIYELFYCFDETPQA